MPCRLWLLLLLLLPLAAHAHFFYRMDTRPPHEVFRDGFTARGDNPSVFEHVVGFTCQPGNPTTAFVAVTADERFAIDWGRQNEAVGTHFYVYRLRASDHFHNAAQSLFHASRQTHDDIYDVTAWTYLAESEWVTRHPVPATNIIEATEYISRGRQQAPERLRHYEHLGASNLPGSINPAPFVWDYGRDLIEPAPATNPLCPTTCFGFSSWHSRGKRSIAPWSVDANDARRIYDNLLLCVGMTASAVLGIDDLLTPWSAAGRTEL
ncbi:hypothetical protein P3W23_11230 [Luteibacter sp. PPL554]